MKGQFIKGQVPWNKGRPIRLTSDEQEARRLAALPRGAKHHFFGKKHSENMRARISAGCLGKKKPPFTKEHRKNMSLAFTGRKMPLMTETHRRKLSMARLGREVSPETRKKIGLANTKNGMTPLYTRIRHSLEYRQWVLAVFRRDNFTCTTPLCGVRGRINAHHIKTFASTLRRNKITSFAQAVACIELWDITNGQTLCVPCHEKTESYRKKKKYVENC